MSSPNSTDTQRIVAVVTPEITSMDNVLVSYPPIAKWESRIACKWRITNLMGETLYFNTIIGEGKSESFATAFTHQSLAAQSMVPALQDHYRKLLADLTGRRWWEGNN